MVKQPGKKQTGVVCYERDQKVTRQQSGVTPVWVKNKLLPGCGGQFKNTAAYNMGFAKVGLRNKPISCRISIELLYIGRIK